MQWEFAVAIAIAVPVILVPVAFVWYLSIGGIYKAIKGTQKGKAVYEEAVKAAVQERELVGIKR